VHLLTSSTRPSATRLKTRSTHRAAWCVLNTVTVRRMVAMYGIAIDVHRTMAVEPLPRRRPAPELFVETGQRLPAAAILDCMNSRTAVAAVLAGAGLPLGALLLSAPAHATRCTDQIDYAGDPRSNAEINSIGASTGQCPTPMTGMSDTVQGLVLGAVVGQPCTSTGRFVFGMTAAGATTVCNDQGNGTGLWVRSIPVIGTRPLGSSCVAGFPQAAQTPDGIPVICSDTGIWIPN